MSAESKLSALLSGVRMRALAATAAGWAMPFAALMLIAARHSDPRPWQLAAALLSLLALIYAYHRLRQLNRPWLARQLDQQCPQLQDSSALALGLEQVDGPLAALQRERMRAWIDTQTLPDLRPRWPWSGLLLIAVICAAAVLATAYWPASVSTPTAVQTAASTEAAAPVSRISASELSVEPPAYTGLQPWQDQSLEQRVPEGARLQWTLTIEPVPASAGLQFHDGEVLTLQRDSDGAWRGERVVAKPTFYRLQLDEAPPLEGDDSWRIEVIADRPPQITALAPERNLTVLEREQRRWPLRFEVSDDYGLGAAELTVTLAQGSGELVEVSERRLRLNGTGDERSRRYALDLQLGAYGFARGDDLIARLSVRDNRRPQAQTALSPSFILRWPAELSADVGDIDGVVQRVMPTWFRSQRQIIIDTEALVERKNQLSAADYLAESNQIGIDQHSLRLRYGQFLGEEAEEEITASAGAGQADSSDHGEHDHLGEDHEGHSHGDQRLRSLYLRSLNPNLQGALPGSNAEQAEAKPKAPASSHAGHNHAGDGTEQGTPTFGSAIDILQTYGHTHDYAEATTLFDPKTRRLLRAALNQMWRAEEQLRTGAPRAALPYEYAALDFIKQAQQAERIHLARVGLELPPIDFSRRLSGDRRDLARPQDRPPLADRDQTLARAWQSLHSDDDSGTPANAEALQALEAWVTEQGEALAGGLDLLAAVDRLQRRPDCQDCVEALRKLLWPLLPQPAVGSLQRAAGDGRGQGYLRRISGSAND